MFDPAELQNTPFAAVPETERLARLNRQLAYAAANSPYYAAALAGLPPLSSLAALARLPFLTPDDRSPRFPS